MLTPLANVGDYLFWAEPPEEESEFTPEDPLALDYLAQQVGLLLLPALTTRTSRAQTYAVVLYGLALVDRATHDRQLGADDRTREHLFLRWERFWALSVMEYRRGELARGDPDAMRGVRGAKRNWWPGDRPLELDFLLIDRQNELASLGAYLSSLRACGLVLPGSLRVSPLGQDIVDAFWDEPEENSKLSAYDDYALSALDPDVTKVFRKRSYLTLAKIGERARLSCLTALARRRQQDRLWRAIFGDARDATTLPLSEIVLSAARKRVIAPREVLMSALEGRWMELTDDLRERLEVALAFGDVFRELQTVFNATFEAVSAAGWILDSGEVVREIYTERPELRRACSALVRTSFGRRLRERLHASAFLELISRLAAASPADALDLILANHREVQRERRRAPWLRREDSKLVVDVTTYNAGAVEAKFPPLKLDVVQSLLRDLGRIR